MEKVYIMKSGNAYKVGVSSNPNARLKHLKIGNPQLELIYQSGFLDNGYTVEKLIHNKLKTYEISNEWFCGMGENEIILVADKLVSLSGKKPHKNTSKSKTSNDLFVRHKGCVYPIERYLKQIEKETQDIQFENSEIEKFVHTLQGYYVPNVFTDAILMSVFKAKSILEIEKSQDVNITGNIYSIFSKEYVTKIKRIEQAVGMLINDYEELNKIIQFIEQAG